MSMSVKTQLAAAIESLPEDITLDEAVRRIYQLVSVTRGLARED